MIWINSYSTVKPIVVQYAFSMWGKLKEKWCKVMNGLCCLICACCRLATIGGGTKMCRGQISFALSFLHVMLLSFEVCSKNGRDKRIGGGLLLRRICGVVIFWCQMSSDAP